MKLILYAVLDTKTGAFSNPFCSLKDDAAIREFSDEVNSRRDGRNGWFNHPEDYALYRIGEYDTSTAEIISESKMNCLVTASAVRAFSPRQGELSSMNGVEKELVS